MKYHIATRTRTKLLTYSICETLAEARETLKNYSHVWRIAIYEQDKLGNITRVGK